MHTLRQRRFERTLGGDFNIQRGRPNPNHRLFGPVTSRTRQDESYQPHIKIHLTQRGAVISAVRRGGYVRCRPVGLRAEGPS
jgi:hypothetical protein